MAQLATPLLADYCAAEVLMTDGTIRRVVAGKREDPTKAALLQQIERFTPRLEARRGAPEMLALTRELGMRSYIYVPLIARERTVGAMTFVREDDEAQASDVATAEELGRRAAVAIDNGRLFEAAQQAVGLREEFLKIAAHELRTPATSLQFALQALSRRAKQERVGEGVKPLERMPDIPQRQASSHNVLVDTLLDVSNLPQGSLPVALSEVDLTDAVRSAVAHLSEPLRASGSELALDVGDPVVGRWDPSLSLTTCL